MSRVFLLSFPWCYCFRRCFSAGCFCLVFVCCSVHPRRHKARKHHVSFCGASPLYSHPGGLRRADTPPFCSSKSSTCLSCCCCCCKAARCLESGRPHVSQYRSLSSGSSSGSMQRLSPLATKWRGGDTRGALLHPPVPPSRSREGAEAVSFRRFACGGMYLLLIDGRMLPSRTGQPQEVCYTSPLLHRQLAAGDEVIVCVGGCAPLSCSSWSSKCRGLDFSAVS